MNIHRTSSEWIQLLFLFAALSLAAASTGCGGSPSSSGTPSTTLTAVSIAPGNASIVAGGTQQFTATATYSDGPTSNVTSTATWSSSNAAVVKINSAGLATAVAAGSTSIAASLNGASGMATVTVPAPTLKSIAVSPASANVSVGVTQQFRATVTYSDGSTSNVTSTATWSSSNAAVVKINSAGLATAVAAGSTSIAASLNGVSGMATVTVPAPTLKSIAVSPASVNVSVGATQQFAATATYSDGSTSNVTSAAGWMVANTSVATISSSGLASGVASGSSTITASLNGVSGVAMLNVSSKTPTSLAVTPNPASFSMEATQQFTATVTYSDSSTANVTSTVRWSSANIAVATISSSGLASGIAVGSTTITASLNGVSGMAMLDVNSKTPTSIAVTPNPASFAMEAPQQFTAMATYNDGSTTNVTSTAAWTVANTSVATISSSGLASGVASGSSTVTASQNGVSGTAPITVTIAAGTGVNIPTFHVDAQRSGLNASELSLTPTNVSSHTFGKLFSYLEDGYVYGEPLIMSNITINGSIRNVLYTATEHDSVYAFDADNYGNGTPLWQVSLLQGGEVPLSGTDIQPYLGVASTPVIDPTTNTIYVVSAQKSSSKGATFRLNALDITTGAQKFGGPVTIQASVPGTNSQSVGGIVTLTDTCIQRAALLLANGEVYIGFGSCHDGWLLAYNAQTLAQTAIFNTSPNLNGEGKYSGGGGIWMGGGGPDADSSGNVYVTTGNGPWDGQTAWSDSLLKFNAQLQMEDYFTPQDYQFMDCMDMDLAAGGLLLIPGTTAAVAGGKMGKMYLVNTGNLGHEQANDAGATQALWFESDIVPPHTDSCVDSTGTNIAQEDYSQIYGTAAYFNGSVYLGVVPVNTVPAGVRQFTYSSGMLTPGSYTTQSVQESSFGTTPFISANGASDGILWMIDHGTPLDENPTTNATLRAYDATDLSDQLYNSSTNPSDVPGYGIKFTSPIVANGKVYITTGHDPIIATNPQGEIDVFGLK